MTQVRSTGLTFFIYGGTQPGRLVGNLQSGETDLRTAFTAVNTAKLFAVTNATQTFVPGNAFSPLQLLMPGRGYAIVGKQAFTFPLGFPQSNANEQEETLRAVQGSIATAQGKPFAVLNASATSITTGTAVTFNANGSTVGGSGIIIGYDWNFGAGNGTSFSNSPTITFNNPGTFPVTLRVLRDSDNVYSERTTRAIVVSGEAIVPQPSPQPAPVPAPNPSPVPSGSANRVAIPVGTYRRFWIGNSVTDAIGDNQTTAGMDAIAASQGFTDQWARHMIPGASPKWIWDNQNAGFNTTPFGYYPNAMANYGWDICHIQPFDLSHVDEIDYFQRYMNLLVTMSGSNLLPAVYQRWPRKRTTGVNDGAYYKQKWDSAYVIGSFDYEKRAFFDLVCNTLRQQETRFKPVITIPVGEVFYQLNELMMDGQVANWDNIFQVYSDDIHMGPITLNGTDYGSPGSYAAAATFYSALYYRRLQNNTVPAGYGAIPNYLRDIINDTVWDVVTTYQYTNNLPQSDNTKPIVSIKASQTEVTTGVSVSFSNYPSTLGNGTSLQTYDWQIENSGNTVVTTSTNSTFNYTFTQAGKYKVSLISGNNNGVNSDEVYRYILVS